MPSEPFEVEYELSQDEDFHAIVRKGSTVALPDEAHSARAEIQGLGPEHEYYYRFRAGSWISPVGRTRTRPNGNSMVPSLTFAFVSCQNFAEGYFTPYDEIAASEDIETVVFLGDYIYEGKNSGGRHARAAEDRSRPWTTTGSGTASTRPTGRSRGRTRRTRG